MTDTEFTVRIVPWKDYSGVLEQIRHQVFVVEQHVPEDLEWDGMDEDCIQAIALSTDGHAIGTARLKSDGQIGRMAVLAPWRNRGVGSALLELLLDTARKKKLDPIFLHAQIQALNFYQRHGFQPKGGQFIEADIPHQEMIYAHIMDK